MGHDMSLEVVECSWVTSWTLNQTVFLGLNLGLDVDSVIGSLHELGSTQCYCVTR